MDVEQFTAVVDEAGTTLLVEAEVLGAFAVHRDIVLYDGQTEWQIDPNGDDYSVSHRRTGLNMALNLRRSAARQLAADLNSFSDKWDKVTGASEAESCAVLGAQLVKCMAAYIRRFEAGELP